MDVNGTRFHLLLGRRDWASCRDDSEELVRNLPGAPEPVGLEWNERTREQTLRELPFRFVAAPNDRRPTDDDRRGAARDRFGNWYFIAEDRRRVRVRSAGTGNTTDFWPISPREPAPVSGGAFTPVTTPSPAPARELAGLAVTAHHYLVVGTVGPAGLLVFDLHAGGPPLVLEWPKDVPLVPFDMSPTASGGVVVFDRQHRRFWLLDARLRVVGTEQPLTLLEPELPDPFQPIDGGKPRVRPARTFPVGVSLELSTPVPAKDPIAIECAPDGSVFVLDRGEGGRIFRFRLGMAIGLPAPLSFELDLPEESESFVFEAHDFALVPAEGEDRARFYVVSAEGNQALAFDIADSSDANLSLEATNEYFPMRLFQGKALVATQAGVFYDHPTGFAPLVEQKRPRFARSGILTTRVFDGREPDCVWHRLVLDARIPEDAAVEVYTRAANELADLERAPFFAEPRLYRRGDGAELAYLSRSAIGSCSSFELLFQRAQGRLLQIRLVVSGNGRSTPRLRALRAWYPRFSYLERYLPAAYREDRESASFLERFLANPEGLLTGAEERIAGAQVLFDVQSAPSDTLPWLASWFGVALDPSWEEAQRRLFIGHAMEFFQYRGTIRGLRMALRLALEPCADESIFTDPSAPSRASARIIELYRSRGAPGVLAGDASEEVGIRFVPPERRWKPAQRRETLEARWQEALVAAGEVASGTEYPLQKPTDASLAAVWAAFSREVLGFVPAATSADTAAWREFLASRYRTPSDLSAAYGTAAVAMGELALPRGLPADGAPLTDWYQFEDLVLPMRRAAHRFRVLIPTRVGDDTAERARRLELALRIIELEKPAHTTFELRFYYAMFRVGEARLGLDSVIDLGGRAPELMAPFVLGPGHLAEGYLAAGPPGDAPERSVLGRDRLQA